MPRLKVTRDAGKLKKLNDLIEQVRVHRDRNVSPTGAVWLRGLAGDSHDLRPSIGRKHFFVGKKIDLNRDAECRLLHQFRRYAYQFFGRTLTEWEAIFVARHHGLPVRLLDWTSDPLAAMYFACAFNKRDYLTDARVWLLIPAKKRRHLDVFRDRKGPLNVKGLRIIYPMVVAERINAQSGLFTIQEDPWRNLDQFETIAFDEKDLDILRLVEFKIPASKRADIVKELNDLGVNERTLYPDLDGLARGLVTAQILRGPPGAIGAV